ncbi:elongation factor 1-gamma [Triplophysa dalaica]|uniref:elongation factor 1-gamma n=1 Tax=Triplophysa dalaica TaxID=1582913 RepID=UPI0024DF98EA|nr:elongation factor 1-gamma [Triplophysa dalaica]
MAAGTLYTYPENWRAFKAQIAAQYSGARLKIASTSPAFNFGQTNRSPAFLSNFPLGKVPAYQGDDGFCLFESNAIAHYLSNDAIRGSTPQAAAQVLQWVSFADSEIIPPASAWVFPTLGIMQFNKQATEQAKEELKRVLAVLNQHLNTRTFLVGERISLADITVACSLLWLYKQVLEPSFRQPYPNVTRWFVTCVNQPQFKAVLGEVKLCEKMAQFDAKKFAEMQPKKDAPAKEKKVSKEGGKSQQQPQQQEKKDKKKEDKKPAPAEEEMDECEAALAAEPKTKDPFAHLPKSSFVLDEFKRKYSNEDTLTVALPYFCDNFDREGFSIWYAEYRFPEELTMAFMSCNLITGMFQRLDKLRKNAFASVILFGTNNDSCISGIWVFRGQDLAFPLSDDWQIDYESYTWRKLAVDSEECKTMVKEYFAWEGEFKHVGKPFNQGKIFK